jgi:membrane-associated protease RseP (regulator of RpoE activity)
MMTPEGLRRLKEEIKREKEKEVDEKFVAIFGIAFVTIFFVLLMVYTHFNLNK